MNLFSYSKLLLSHFSSGGKYPSNENSISTNILKVNCPKSLGKDIFEWVNGPAIEVTNSDAVHPGYGFLSENYNFARMLKDNNIKFVGPSPEIIKMMGDKIEAKNTAKKYGIPVIEGSEGGVSSCLLYTSPSPRD